MKLAIDIARFTAWLSIAVLCVAATLVVLSFSGTATQINATVATYDKTGQTANKAVNDLRVTLDNVNKGAIEERHYLEQELPATAARLNRSLDDTDALLTSVRGTSDQARQTLAGVTADAHELAMSGDALVRTANGTLAEAEPLVGHLDGFAQQATGAAQRFDGLLRDPAIPQMLGSGASMMRTGDHMLFTFDAVETKYTRSYLHPSSNPLVRFGQAARPFALPAAQVGGFLLTH